ncbi:hypothetical protein QBC38DRAFT_224209 [Podospora fimiseda]|uniref:Uncharacterized protein n=1 Tax=Podospora fimiseda TaxID=252190 RepID=A0AAN7BY16_9PEZI|nr:hypothetical protein QBC38DRAFT_224209 [Podospora fimiseda]
MSKRRASDDFAEQPLRSTKRSRLEGDFTEKSLRSKKRTRTENDFAEQPMRSTKRARLESNSPDSSPRARTRARSPDPWPSIVEYHRRTDVKEMRKKKLEIQARRAFDKSESRFRQARKEYIRFRRNRLPSPAPSEDGSVDFDSDADEFGFAPLMFNLDNEDSEVADVFDAAFVRQLREGMRRRAAALAVGGRKRVKQWPAVIPDHHTITRRGGQRGSSNTSRSRTVRACAVEQRITRQSRQIKFYELDYFGNARLVS